MKRKPMSQATKEKMRLAHLGVKRPNMRRELNPAWKGKDATYFSKHIWLFDNFGKASKCENKICAYKNPKRYEWALIKGREHDHNRENYMMLCVSCHRKYDYTEKQRETTRQIMRGMTGEKHWTWIKREKLLANI